MTDENIPETSQAAKDGIKIVGLLHLIGNIFSGGLLGAFLALAFLAFKQNITTEEKQVCYDIINFNISFVIWIVISALSMFILIGFVALPIVLLIWFVTLVIGGIKHINGERYQYPMTIDFLKL